MLITADVKCLSCGRLCGEVEGEDSLPLLFAAIRPWQGPEPCAAVLGRPLRCRHCGGVGLLEGVQRVFRRAAVEGAASRGRRRQAAR